MIYKFLSPALLELEDAAHYYEEQVPGLGVDFLHETDSAIGRMIRHPEAWGFISTGYRHCSLQRFPYTIIYSIEGEDLLLIISVFHQNRNPMSWLNNLL